MEMFKNLTVRLFTCFYVYLFPLLRLILIPLKVILSVHEGLVSFSVEGLPPSSSVRSVVFDLKLPFPDSLSLLSFIPDLLLCRRSETR